MIKININNYEGKKMKKKDIAIVIIVLVILSLIFLFKFFRRNDNVILDKSDNNIQAQQEIEIKSLADTKQSNEAPQKEYIAVYISGQVKEPKVVELKSDSRLIDAIQKCGGFLEDADKDAVNLAVILKDEEHYIVPKIGEINVANGQADSSEKNVAMTGLVSQTPKQSGKININTADKSELMKLPKVGDKTADKIITYRQNNGNFQKIEDIKNISGIGDKTFDSMKDMITVE